MRLKNKNKVFAITMIIAMIMTVLSSTIRSHAEDITIYYLNNVIDFNGYTVGDFNTTYDNYLINYNDVDGYLKTDIYSDNNYNVWLGRNFIPLFDSSNTTGLDILDRFIYSINNDYNPAEQFNFKSVEVAPVVVNGQTIPQENIKYLICWQQNQNNYNWNFEVYSIYIPENTICFLEQGRLMASNNDVYISGITYNVYTPAGEDYLTFSKYQDIATTNQYYTTYDFNTDNTPDLYQYYITLNCWFYSDIPVYYMYENNSDNNGAFLNQNPYYYGDYTGRGGVDNSVGKYVLSGDDTTGFIVDRRTSAMINGSGGGSDTQGILGVLSGSYKHLFTGISQDKCDLFISYELNDYTKSLRDRVKLVLDYEVNIEGSYSGNSIHFSNTFSDSTGNLDYYNVFNSNILQIDMDNVFSKIMSDPLSDTIPDSFIPAEYYGVQAAALYHSYSALNYFDFMLSQGGFGITQSFNHESSLMEDLFSGNYTVDGSTANRNWVIPSQSTLGYVFGSSYDYYTTNNNAVLTTCNFVVTEYLLDSNGNRSNTNTYMYDLLTGNYQVVGGFETDGDTTFTKYNGQNYATNPVPYNSTAGGYSIVGGNPQAYGGSANASIGDININVGAGGTAGQLLVDMPADEWLQHSPNFNNLITTLKTGITSVSTDSQSVAVMLKDTYAIFPIEVWGYLALAICTISSLAVIRYIRRG